MITLGEAPKLWLHKPPRSLIWPWVLGLKFLCKT